MTDIDTIVSEYEAVRKAFMKKGQDAFKAAFKTFFEENPEIKSIAWEQYTPYFNDGDECIFSVHDMYFSTTIDDINKVEQKMLWGDSEDFKPDYWGDPLGIKFKEFTKSISKLPKEMYKEAFGDHKMVLATRNGFDTEDSEHD